MLNQAKRSLPLVGLLLLVPVGGYSFLKLKRHLVYKQLMNEQRQIINTYEKSINFNPYRSEALPGFSEHLAVVPNFLPAETFEQLKAEAVQFTKAERTYLPGHKKGGTISYEELHKTAPKIVALYHSPRLHQFISHLIGEPVQPTPIHDQSSCSLLCYTKPGDHIGWHYDYNFYNGRHFTLLMPLVNEHNLTKGPSSAQLLVRRNDHETPVPTGPNSLIVFEGARTLHRATPIAENETRIMLSMTYCTDPSASLVKSVSRRFKDTAFFGIRALWT